MLLNDILEHKRKEVNELKQKMPLDALIKKVDRLSSNDRRSLKEALTGGKKPHFICELKKASPSEGLIREVFDVHQIAQEFQEAGASALSVLTERHYFQGEPDYLNQARSVTTIPILRKDFICDPYQIYESRILEADAILLIVRLLTQSQLEEMMTLAKTIKLDVLVEVHTKEELDRAVKAGSDIIGINNRDLDTLKIDLSTSEYLIAHVPQNVTVIVESGIETRQDVERYQRLGIRAFLIGTSLMKSKNVKAKLSELITH
jgi:indole-3-glycerol phosphate synthase